MIARETLFPYTFSYSFPLTTPPFSSTSGAFSYFTIAFQADNNLGLSALEISANTAYLASAGGATSAVQVIEASYASVLSADVTTGPPAVPTIPNDSGNVIYRNEQVFQINTIASGLGTKFVSVNDFNRYEPYDYVIKFRQFLYIHVGVDTTLLPAITSLFVISVNLHTLPTGLKT